ncbi:ECF transporter S component [Mycoplasmatota bacterium]|nr:ECF transporter S component [Mycoplasmatota bacterium]
MNTKKIVYSGFLIAFGVLLPIIFHFIPGNLGLILLPIHYSAYFAGGFFGPIIGGIVGLFTPIISYQLTGMPPQLSFIYIAAETFVYGLVFGFLYYKRHLNIYVSLLISMILGRITNFTGTYIIANVILGNMAKPYQIVNIFYNFSIGLMGAVFQFLIIPLVIKRINMVFSFDKQRHGV